ncbi:MAG: methionyl-tRNA formyltransferase [Lachnospiraceae bacterium]|nr:methionyl-tRNA formyltransferase [Lachnospiraceae bacterium]
MRVIFMGTPDFASGVLKEMVKNNIDVVLAVTQPDRVSGRGKKVSMSEVKTAAVEAGIPVFQPEKIKEPDAVLELKKYNPDLMVVAAFGQILSKEILDMPQYGCINVHASLLPKYRGAAPIQQAIIDGEKETGVTIMQMNEGLDTGDILMQESIEINPDETGGSLFDRLSVLGADMAVRAVSLIEKGELTPTPQDDDKSTYAKMLKKETGNIDFDNHTAEEVERLIRALNPWPSAYTRYSGKILKLWTSCVLNGGYTGEERPGTIIEVCRDELKIVCKTGILSVKEVQLEGKKRMSVHDFLLGVKIEKGTVLG